MLPLAKSVLGDNIAIVRSNMERFLHCFPYKYERQRPIRVIGNNVPAVDVFITCCGEDIEVIKDTVRATCALDYPTEKFRVFVLDDGASTTLECTIFSMQRNNANLYYTARKKPKVPDFKAGNLNHGILHSQTGGNPAEFVAGLDADVIADPSWLRATIPHLLRDPNLGMIGPPQVVSHRR